VGGEARVIQICVFTHFTYKVALGGGVRVTGIWVTTFLVSCFSISRFNDFKTHIQIKFCREMLEFGQVSASGQVF